MTCSDSPIVVTLLQAWRFWFEGCPTGKLVLWGYQVFWWGRLGKVIELASALTIVAELIGSDKLHKFGRMLKINFGHRSFMFFIRNITLSIKAFSGYQKGSNELSSRAALFLKEIRTPLLVLALFSMLLTNGNIAMVLFLIILSIAVNILYKAASIIVGLLEEDKYKRALLLEISSMGLLVSLPVIILLTVVETLLFKPIAWLLEGQFRDKLIKLISILLFLLGFHFDLLAS